MPEWRIEFAGRLRHRSGRGNIQRGRAVPGREPRLNRCSPDRNIGCKSTDNWSRSSSCYSRIRMGNRRNSSYFRNRDSPRNNSRRSTGTRRNILRSTETLFRRFKKRDYSANRVDES